MLPTIRNQSRRIPGQVGQRDVFQLQQFQALGVKFAHSEVSKVRRPAAVPKIQAPVAGGSNALRSPCRIR
jgi:hypothetical protein